ncbi:hypothetical protein KR018_000081 [Drosophila ironensis]|nr:hypothetical protein KR018_000081 [Drosophila ironensis]
MDPQKITELANLLRQNGDKILSSEFTLTLSGSLLRALNDSFTLIDDTDLAGGGGAGPVGPAHSHHQNFQVVKPINAKSSVFSDLQLLHDFVQKTTLLKLTYFPSELHFEGAIDICKFRALRRLEVHKISIGQVVGIQPLRGQLQHLICTKSLARVDDIITCCGGDNSNGFVWNELQSADFSYNNLRSVDTALEFAQHLQHLSLRHNKLTSVAAIKWLPHLKSLDLSYNCLTHLPQFHMETCRRLQYLNVSNNYVEELLDVAKLDALCSLDLSDNCLLEHSQLLPLSAVMTLTTLYLQGNPLACNPKHRKATAQYLHKNTSTVKFVLDLEPLSKAEKALTGSHKWRYIGSNMSRTSSVSINSSSASINTSDGSQFSSFGSQRSVSLRGKEYSSEAEQLAATMNASQTSRRSGPKKNLSRVRTVDIEDVSAKAPAPKPPQVAEEPVDVTHLETKRQIEALRLTYGNEWLRGGNTELMLGIQTQQPNEQERKEARQEFNKFLGEFGVSSDTGEEPLNISSTPTNNTLLGAPFDATLTPVKADAGNESGPYETCDEGDETHYESLADASEEQATDDKHKESFSLYANSSDAAQEENPVSDAEPDEETYIVYHEQKPSEPLFLTLSSNFIREKDTLTERTKTKWSLKLLESCERVKSNTLRINFKTMRKDKQERQYCMENTLCQELEKKLRHILSQRDLTDMNITIYRCVNCMSQFTIEKKSKRYHSDGVRCPDCNSVYVAEVSNLSTSVDKPLPEVAMEPKISPALIVEESPAAVSSVPVAKEDNNSIGKSLSTDFPFNPFNSVVVHHRLVGSANSLNDSSSCSKITNSRSSFDSNQSVVGSSNTDRDLEFRANESDVDIISNPSQSSIEVLDPAYVQSASRKASVEQSPPIGDVTLQAQAFPTPAAPPNEAAPAVAQVQLTESSSSGSVTDSICTSYEQQGKDKPQNPTPSSLLTQSGSSQASQEARDKEVGLLQFASVFQSTNLLMSSSKKLIESEATVSGTQAYKFNFKDFNDIDHRLKFYFYQQKFKDGEHFKWLAKGRIYNEKTQALSEGLVVMSTKNLYLMEAFAAPEDDVAKWLRQVVSVAVERLVAVEPLPWKLGVSFALRDWGKFVLLMLDMQRTDSWLLYMQDNPLSAQCTLSPLPSPAISKCLEAIESDAVKMCAMLPRCQWSCNQEKKSFQACLLLTTESHLYLAGNGKFQWLLAPSPPPMEFSLSQPMSNLVDMERISGQEYVIKFIDETQNRCEIWRLHFETQASAESCLNAVGQDWERLFGVPFTFLGT